MPGTVLHNRPHALSGAGRAAFVASALILAASGAPALADGPGGPAAARPAAPQAAPSTVPPAAAPAGHTAMWPDDRPHRAAALALVEQLRAALLSETSATLTLERWCRTHRIAADPQVVAVPDPNRVAPPDQGQRTLLGIGPDEPVRYRHVRLFCGETLLSEADNWYVPSRLTASMNQVLDATHTPFGKVIAPLGFTRTTLSSRLGRLPPDGSETSATLPSAMPDTLIENSALLRDRNGRPLALLLERYRPGILAFPPPPP